MCAKQTKLLKNIRVIFFTDLDGTLLDSRYSFDRALPALSLIREKNIPLVLCSSKTRSEIEHWRKKLNNRHPFISENGGGLFMPKHYFKDYEPGFRILSEGNYYVIKLGALYIKLRETLAELKNEGFKVKGFGDMNIREVMKLTGLKYADAKRAKEREFDEPFVIQGNSRKITYLKRRIRNKGFNYTEGELFHIMGDSDKGRAVGILKTFYSKKYHDIVTAALGDSPNDIEMLRNVDYPVIVRKENGLYDRRLKINNIIKADGIGPEGWKKAVVEILDRLGIT